MTKEFDPEEARRKLGAVGTQMVELATQRLARHITYESVSALYTSGNVLDIRMRNMHIAENYPKMLKPHDRMPAAILFDTIMNIGLTGYLTEEVTRAMLRGDRNYNILDILAVGSEGRAWDYASYMGDLRRARGGKLRLSLGKHSRTFEIRRPEESIGVVLSAEAAGNFVLETNSFWHFGSSPIRLCVLTDKVYEEMHKPFEERQSD